MKKLEHFVESIILASRWLLVVFYLGLAAALALYAISFGKKLLDFVGKITVLEETDTILKMLGLIDAALVASLLVMVIISGYENFVSRFDNADGELSWLGKIDAGSLKVKVASTIVAISSIHLLQVFLNAQQYADDKLMWLTIMHMAFVVSALFLAYIDRVMAQTKKDKGDEH
ncbi:MAG TPA: TIGR00645 family protein [Aestuariivirga sp.]|nr:TIGR00645 family protein [Alphaproteobacteria bacterium]HRX35495.1 TIGR00645 family protein [Aestuariivirga sp.]